MTELDASSLEKNDDLGSRSSALVQCQRATALFASGEREQGLTDAREALTLVDARAHEHVDIARDVRGLDLASENLGVGFGDWRYDEFRVGRSEQLIHEIEWQNYDRPSTWLIEADDIEFDSTGTV